MTEVVGAGEAGRLKDQVAVITGATSGLGIELARVFAEKGARVFGSGRRIERGNQVQEDLRSAGLNFSFVPCDVRKADDCAGLVEHVAERTGDRLDILVNNAGTVGDPAILDSHEATETWWDEIVETNLKGAFFCASKALRVMLAQRHGVIINVASTNALEPLPLMQAYNASKAALVHLTRGLAVEYQATGIRVNAVVLGAVAGETGLATARAFKERLTGDPELGRLSMTKRIGQRNRDVANAIAGLCTSDYQLITGAAIPIDRGVSAGLLGSTAMITGMAGQWDMPLGPI